MKVKTTELAGAALDWAVSKCEGVNGETFRLYYEPQEQSDFDEHGFPEFHYSTIWSQGGPIIEREGIELLCNVSAIEASRFKEAHADWFACNKHAKQAHYHGTTPLIAAMRCYVTSKIGDEVNVPKELL